MMSGPGMVSLSCERARRLLTFSLAHLRPGRGVELLTLTHALRARAIAILRRAPTRELIGNVLSQMPSSS